MWHSPVVLYPSIGTEHQSCTWLIANKSRVGTDGLIHVFYDKACLLLEMAGSHTYIFSSFFSMRSYEMLGNGFVLC
jgi:hypothetical protein